jgi:hypothetical protein
MTGLRRLESQESAQPQLSSVPTLAATVNRLNLTTHVPRTDSNSVNLSFGKSGKSPVHAEMYQTLSLKLISSLKTRGIRGQVSSLSSPNPAHDFLRISRLSPSPLQILIQPPAALRNAIYEGAQQGYASAAQKTQSYPNWDKPLFLFPKTFTTFDPTSDFDSSLPP